MKPDRSHPSASLQLWVADPIPAEVRACVEKIRGLDDVRHVAVMPDVHISGRVCVGTVVATSSLIYPEAIGGDIGCGYSGVGLDAPSDVLAHPDRADQVFARLHEFIPLMRHRRLSVAPPVPVELTSASHPSVAASLRREARIELGTLGRGNHFLEFQADEDNRLWILVHSGSRALGQAVSTVYAPAPASRELAALTGGESSGAEFMNDHDIARSFARENRRLILESACRAVAELLRAPAVEQTRFDTDHNHVSRERHGDRDLWVHRKGANRAQTGAFNVIPGSMGTRTYHVRGRGLPQALESSSHGAGRRYSRAEAWRRISRRELDRQLSEVWVEPSLRPRLIEEAPSAYKDVDAVMRAQRALVKIERRLRPVLVYKSP